MADGAWGCAMCTFENARAAAACEICLTPRRQTPAKPQADARASPSSGSTTRRKSPPMKKQKLIQAPLVAVGSSNEKEALRLKKKVEQMKELGIDLPANDMLALLAKHCYSVMVAASAYFEQLATASSEKISARDSEAESRLASAVTYFERSFAREQQSQYRLLGRKVLSATLNRSSVALATGDRLVLQAENAGKKRLRPGVAAGSSPGPSSLSAGIIRIATTQNALVGRLDREIEMLLQPLMKEKLIALGGVCHAPPMSSQMFASFQVLVFVYVSTTAFAIFNEEHPQFHLSDTLYATLEMLHAEKTPEASTAATAIIDAANDAEDNDAGLEALFSDFVDAGDDESDDKDDDGEVHNPADQLRPYLNDIELRDHQKAAVRWMAARENQGVTKDAQDDELNPMWEARQFGADGGSYFINRFEKTASLRAPQPPAPCRGGILADDMGMGKTMMMLSLAVYQKHSHGRPDEDDEAAMAPTLALSTQRRRKQIPSKTLIVCPLSLLHQWKNEIDERFRANTLTYHVYYGDEREHTHAIRKSDIVLTTYGVLSKEYEKPNGGGVLVTTPWLRVILDEAHSIKNRMTTYFKACACLQATHRWCLTGTPLQNSLDDLFSLLSFLQYEPWSRLSWWKRVITTPFEQGDDVNALGRLKVILTPILLRRTKHSRDKHGRSLVQLPPKHMELVKLHFSDDERAFYQAVYDKSRAEFNGFVASGTASTSYVAIFALLLRLRQACNHPFLALGRNFEQAQNDAEQSKQPKQQSNCTSQAQHETSLLFQPQTNESMESYYRRISAQLQQDMQHASRSQSELLSSSPSIDGESENARSSGLTTSYIENVLAQVEEGLESHECPVCLDPPVRGVLTACAHVLCEQCLRDSLVMDPDSGCPVCRAVVDMNKVFVLPAPPEKRPHASEEDTKVADEVAAGDNGQKTTEEAAATRARNTGNDGHKNAADVFVSTKLKQLLHDLEAIRRENEAPSEQTEHDNAEIVTAKKKRKVVVFSQWTYMLEMVATLLQRHGFAHCMFHGAMPQETRERVLTKFAKDPTMDVLSQGRGVGLNLTCASVVILLDPWWNPGVEDQAVDRVHRLGQDQSVLVKRYVVDETVEDMILQLQQRKDKLAKHVLVASKHGDEKRSERLSLEDLKSFFR
uniref:RanBP-type and C3HC4-type zinc finger-containing protein 1 n=1 Tax=Globisporangium ultimum (strain ATCC 200006 / CBS 805.95 / DAOM BR144) TaxID=431595 RepID=K3W4X7_GLOUD